MKKNSLLSFILVSLFAIIGFGSESQQTGELIKYQALSEASCSDGTKLTSYKVSYYTTDTNGFITQASGVFYIPTALKNSSLSLVSYQHGTILHTSQSPSAGFQNNALWACAFGKDKMITAQDYLGFGDSNSFHPYHHWKTEASSAIDLIKAAVSIMKEQGFHWNDRLYVTGYSQGGHSAMSVLKELSLPNAPFKVTASAPLSGAYDLSGTSLTEMMKEPAPYDASVYIGYVLSAYREIYPDAHVNELVLSKYIPFIDAFIHQDVPTIKKLAPMYPRELFSQDGLLNISTNPEHPFVKALAKNNVYDFQPVGPVFFCYAGGDKSVPPQNSIMAHAHLKSLGAEVSILNVGNELNHFQANPLCESEANKFFNNH